MECPSDCGPGCQNSKIQLKSYKRLNSDIKQVMTFGFSKQTRFDLLTVLKNFFTLPTLDFYFERILNIAINAYPIYHLELRKLKRAKHEGIDIFKIYEESAVSSVGEQFSQERREDIQNERERFKQRILQERKLVRNKLLFQQTTSSDEDSDKERIQSAGELYAVKMPLPGATGTPLDPNEVLDWKQGRDVELFRLTMLSEGKDEDAEEGGFESLYSSLQENHQLEMMSVVEFVQDNIFAHVLLAEKDGKVFPRLPELPEVKKDEVKKNTVEGEVKPEEKKEEEKKEEVKTEGSPDSDEKKAIEEEPEPVIEYPLELAKEGLDEYNKLLLPHKQLPLTGKLFLQYKETYLKSKAEAAELEKKNSSEIEEKETKSNDITTPKKPSALHPEKPYLSPEYFEMLFPVANYKNMVAVSKEVEQEIEDQKISHIEYKNEQDKKNEEKQMLLDKISSPISQQKRKERPTTPVDPTIEKKIKVEETLEEKTEEKEEKKEEPPKLLEFTGNYEEDIAVTLALTRKIIQLLAEVDHSPQNFYFNKFGDKIRWRDPIFKVSAKGRGVVSHINIKTNDFINVFTGEVYPVWRWCELTDSQRWVEVQRRKRKRKNKSKKKTSSAKGEMNTSGFGELEFFNIMLERHMDDPEGYDLVFVDPSKRGSYASRLSHSCNPNCVTVPMISNGKYHIAIYAIRDISPGEELTIDYMSVTESEQEWRQAVCLCMNHKCRGWYLSYAGSTSFQQIMKLSHTFLHRQAITLKASLFHQLFTQNGGGQSISEFLSKEDLAFMKKYNLLPNQSVLKNSPFWLVKFTAYVLKYICYEQTHLPTELLKENSEQRSKEFAITGVQPENNYTYQDAVIEANGVVDNRVQNLVISIKKIQHVLNEIEKKSAVNSHQTHHIRIKKLLNNSKRRKDFSLKMSNEPLHSQPPLRLLTKEEIVNRLWNGEESVAKSIWKYIDTLNVKDIDLTDALKKQIYDLCHSECSLDGNGRNESLKDVCPILDKFQDTHTGFQLPSLTKKLLSLRNLVLQLQPISAAYFHAVADVLTMYAHTRVWFSCHLYPSIESEPFLFEEIGLKSKTFLGKRFTKPKKYSAQYIWGALCYWFKQTIESPDASLSQNRRGTISLPTIESCFVDGFFNHPDVSGVSIKRSYDTKTRSELMNLLCDKPYQYWPVSWHYGFRVKGMYGSPWMDEVLLKNPSERFELLTEYKIQGYSMKYPIEFGAYD